MQILIVNLTVLKGLMIQPQVHTLPTKFQANFCYKPHGKIPNTYAFSLRNS